MAKVSITHRCGHESTENLTGKQSDRDRRKAWLEGGDCPACYTAKRNAEAAEAAAKIEAELGLPEITDGSEKQNSYARALRATMAKTIVSFVATLEASTSAQGAELRPTYVAYAKRILRQDSAKYWIDRHNSGAYSSVRSVADYIRARLAEQSAKAELAAK